MSDDAKTTRTGTKATTQRSATTATKSASIKTDASKTDATKSTASRADAPKAESTKTEATGSKTTESRPADVETRSTRTTSTKSGSTAGEPKRSPRSDAADRWKPEMVSLETVRLAFLQGTPQAHGVEEIKRRLRDAGHYDGDVDDAPDDATRTAYATFQRAIGASSTDGVPDRESLEALGFYVTS